MTLRFDLFWSFRSPYSYLATPRLVELEREYDVEVGVRPVLPLAVRDTTFFQRVNPLWPPYLLRDTTRIAQYLGLPYTWPRPDPVQPVPPTEQPYIHRLTRLGVRAAERGRGLPFLYEVSRVIFGGTESWHEGDHLARAAERVGLDLSALDADVEREPERYAAAIEENQKALEAAGHWGVPTMVFEGEPFFGQDRIDLLVWRLEQHGLKRRT
jgi:2-hydroxychromene-2-carboxylate isomerase